MEQEKLKQCLIEIANVEDILERENKLKSLAEVNGEKYSILKKWVNKYLDDNKTKKKDKQEKKWNESLKLQKQSHYNSLNEKEKIKLQFLEMINNNDISKATELLVHFIETNNHIYTTKNDIKTEIWFYKDGIYTPQGKSEIKIIIRDILGENFSNYISNIIISKIETDTFIDEKEFFQNNYIYEVPVQNGILNTLSREIKPFTSDKIFFNKLPVTFNKNATCEKIDKFLSDVLANADDKKVFYELGGYSLLKESRFEKAFMMTGGGRNGKGKTIELLKRVFGIENCASLPLCALNPESFEISELFGKMLNLAGDIANTDFKDTSMFKSLTGRDLVIGKRKFLTPIYFYNYAKFIFACNELPRVYDVSKGFWERWILFEFPYTFEDKEIFEKLKEKDKLVKLKNPNIIEEISTPEELSGLLNKFLDGLDRLLKNKKFSSTKGTDEIKNLWIRKSNPFMAFCMDNLEESPTEYIFKDELRKEFLKYCKQHKIRGSSDRNIKFTLQEMFGVDEKQLRNINMSDGTIQNPYVWGGIRFKCKSSS